MAQSATEDMLMFELKNAFYIGNYQQCIKLSSDKKGVVGERELFMYRAYCAQGKYKTVLEEIDPSTATPTFLTLRIVAQYLQGPHDKSLETVTALDRLLLEGYKEEDQIVPILAAGVYMHQQNYSAALTALHNITHLEAAALRVQIYISMARLDLAKTEIKAMLDKDDDNTLTQLAQAWFNLSIGGERVQDAYYAFQELMDKFVPTAQLLNGQACCHLLQNKWEEAEALLQDSLEKDSNNPDTLFNIYVVSQQLKKPPDFCKRYLRQLEDVCPSYQYLQDFKSKEALFSEAEQLLKVTT
ncbi:Coatomer subunit epsilon [Oopsacas minuta]|uniref:Coatomer subunit epsilon n=1 Tax=Oopsacas minuta TaxID=111878 RepID=A0AAV7KGE0_9METZ|nr:Coatomer subunit epsilon [Oopsacas minuta]